MSTNSLKALDTLQEIPTSKEAVVYIKIKINRKGLSTFRF